MQIVQIDGAARAILGRAYPAYELCRLGGRVATVQETVAKPLQMMSDSLPDNVPFMAHTVKMVWLDDQDGHLVWAGVCEPCRRVYYWTKQ